MILLSAGHYPKSSGACFNGFCEWHEATQWVSLIKKQLKILNSGVRIMPIGNLNDKINYTNHLPVKPTLLVEIHFNSDPTRRGVGCESLYCPGSVLGEKYAGLLQKDLAKNFQPDRNIKEGWYRMDKPGVVDFKGDVDGDEKLDSILLKTNCPAVIIEPDFIHNKYKILDNREVCCFNLAITLHRINIKVV
jgi:N-acetylmuramoyl-L-alanine amidase